MWKVSYIDIAWARLVSKQLFLWFLGRIFPRISFKLAESSLFDFFLTRVALDSAVTTSTSYSTTPQHEDMAFPRSHAILSTMT